MNKDAALSLSKEALRVADLFSLPDRENNFSGETFKVEKIRPLSDLVAAVTYRKSSGKFALAVFIFLPKTAGGRWMYFFPTDSHLVGLQQVHDLKAKLEDANFTFNFQEVQP